AGAGAAYGAGASGAAYGAGASGAAYGAGASGAAYGAGAGGAAPSPVSAEPLSGAAAALTCSSLQTSQNSRSGGAAGPRAGASTRAARSGRRCSGRPG